MTERIEKEVQVRNDLINQIPANKNVKALLHCLTGFAYIRGPQGQWHLTLSWSQIGERLLRSVNTVKSYMRQAAPFVEILGGNGSKNPNTKYTFVIHWLAILNRETTADQAAECTGGNVQNLQAAECTAECDGFDYDDGGYQPSHPRVSEMTSEGVNFESGGCQNEGINSPHTPSENLLREEQVTKNLLVLPKPSSPSSIGQPTKRAPSLLPRHQCSRNRHEVRQRTRAVCWTHFKTAASATDLSKPDQVQKLYAIAVELQIVDDSQVNRFHVFCQAAKQVRMCRTGQATTRHGLFTSNVAQNKWFCDQPDEETARRMIERADLHLTPAEAERRQEIDSICAATLRDVPAEAKPLSKEQCDAKKEVITLRLIEKYPDLFGLPY